MDGIHENVLNIRPPMENQVAALLEAFENALQRFQLITVLFRRRPASPDLWLHV